MKRSFLVLIALGLLVSLVLAACGDNTATTNVKPAATVGSTTSAATATTVMAMTTAAGTSTTSAVGSTTSSTSSTTAVATTSPVMANMTTAAAASTTAKAGMTTPAAGATTAAATTMAGMDHGSMTMTPSANDPMTESLKNLTGQEFETKFMQEMIVHHQLAIDMAKLVPTNTKRPELLKLSQDIITAQTKEISDMTGWLATWYNTKPLSDSMSVPGMMDMMGQMDKLKAAKDAQFDEMFLQMMITHHQQAVNMANLLPAKTQRPELLKLGQDIVKAQTAEIEQMKGWQKQWNLKA